MPLYLLIEVGVTFSKNWSCPPSNRLLLKDRGDHVSPFCMDQECKFTKIILYIIFGKVMVLVQFRFSHSVKIRPS